MIAQFWTTLVVKFEVKKVKHAVIWNESIMQSWVENLVYDKWVKWQRN
jgi:hypothetical protein